MLGLLLAGAVVVFLGVVSSKLSLSSLSERGKLASWVMGIGQALGGLSVMYFWFAPHLGRVRPDSSIFSSLLSLRLRTLIRRS